jgi:hypothetical protein
VFADLSPTAGCPFRNKLFVKRRRSFPTHLFAQFTWQSNPHCLFRALRPAKPYENGSESSRIGKAGSGEIDSSVEKSRPFNCLIRSVRR